MTTVSRHCDYPGCKEPATHAAGMLFYCTPHLETVEVNRAKLIAAHHERRRYLEKRKENPDA